MKFCRPDSTVFCGRLAIVVAATLALAWAAAAVADDGQATIFEDDFERATLGDGYTSARGMDGAWTIVEGVLVGKQTKSDHGAVIRKNIPFDDIELEFDFRFNGGSRFNFVLDDQNEKSVHAGHICRVSVTPKRVSVSDDKTGSMNLEVRQQRQAKNLSPTQKESLEKLLAKTSNSAPVKLSKGQWYRLSVRIQGDLLQASLDGTKVVELRSPGIDHPTKSKLGMTVNGATIDFDNLKVFSTH